MLEQPLLLDTLYNGRLATRKIEHEHKKAVNTVRLVNVADRVDVHGLMFEAQRERAAHCVHGNDQNDAHDLPLEQRTVVVLQVLKNEAHREPERDNGKEGRDAVSDG